MEKRSISTLALDGGALCFNFTNTIHDRTEDPVVDCLTDFHAWFKWLRKVKGLSRSRLDQLEEYAKKNPDEAGEILAEVKWVREVIYRLFSSVAAGKQVDEEVLAVFNTALSDALSNLKIGISNKNAVVQWEKNEVNLHEPLWVILKSCYDLLMHEDFERIKQCEFCGWLFLDQSKNKSRRWCSMDSCGSIHKAKNITTERRNGILHRQIATAVANCFIDKTVNDRMEIDY